MGKQFESAWILNLNAAEWVEVRGREEILATSARSVFQVNSAIRRW